jgi:hypothetical protein
MRGTSVIEKNEKCNYRDYDRFALDVSFSLSAYGNINLYKKVINFIIITKSFFFYCNRIFIIFGRNLNLFF